MDNLETFTTAEIVQELGARHQTSLFILVRADKKGEGEEALIEYVGSLTHAYGLANFAVNSLGRELSEGEYDPR